MPGIAAPVRAAVPAFLLLAAVVLALAGCGGGRGPISPTSPLGTQCGDVPDGAIRVTVAGAGGRQLGGAAIGPARATVGLVIAYGASQTLCDWLGEAAAFSKATGARVLIVDRRGVGASGGPIDPTRWVDDVVRSARWLRQHGASRVALLGSSMGTPIAFVAASPTGPRLAVFPNRPRATVLAAPPCAVIAISPVTDAEDEGGSISALAIGSFASPVFLAFEQGTPQIVRDAALLAARVRAAGAASVTQLPVPGSDHSIGLVEQHRSVERFVERALASCA